MYKSQGELKKAGDGESIRELLQKLSPFSLLSSLMAAVGGSTWMWINMAALKVSLGNFLLSWQELQTTDAANGKGSTASNET